MNRIIKLLIFADIFVLTGFGLIEPIFSIFIKDNLIGGSLVTAGIASTIFIVTKSITQLPFAHYVDRKQNREFFLILGGIVIAIVPFFYAYSIHIYSIYLAQALYGLGAALAYPTWLSLFSTNLDRKRESFEWAVYSTSVGLGTALAAFAGAGLASMIGFKKVFFIVGIFSIASVIILFFLGKPRKKTGIQYEYVLEKTHRY